VNQDVARLKVTALLNLASHSPDTLPVEDLSWFELITIGNWAKSHSAYPGFVMEAVPHFDSRRRWGIVKHCAQAILDSLDGRKSDHQK
jgi:hypothetical protein